MIGSAGELPGAPSREDPSGFSAGPVRWMSDLLAEVLRSIEIEYLVQVPGSSYSGLHDSIVHHLGNRSPQLVLALDELAAVAIAHGYAKATGRMMAAALHANVGVLRAAMAIYNAWCDEAPVLLIGGTGPDNEERRTISDWIHTGANHAAPVRDFLKWTSQPRSISGSVDALYRAAQTAQTAPRGPTLVSFAADFQDTPLRGSVALRSSDRYRAPPACAPPSRELDEACELLASARHPVVLMGRCSQSEQAWLDRIELAERLDAPVLTHIRMPAAFPTDHPLHVSPPFFQWLPEEAKAELARADVVLALDWPDLHDTLIRSGPTGSPAKVIKVRVANDANDTSGNGRRLAPADIWLPCETDAAVKALLARIKPRGKSFTKPGNPVTAPANGGLTLLANALRQATEGLEVCYTRFPFRWDAGALTLRGPLDYIGYDGGSGVGSGPGITVGAALGLAGTGRLPIGVLGDGDFLMGSSAVWTAVHYNLPAVFVIANNGSFLTDEHHQAAVARRRDRPSGNEWIGCRIDAPAIDLAQMARSMGAKGIGPVPAGADILGAIGDAIAFAQKGLVAVVDVRL